MKFSEQWLREWVNPEIDTATLVSQLTMAGLEVDDVIPVAPAFSGVVIGQVLSTEPHPDADKLSVCRVSDGREQLQVVCGAANVRAGLKVPFATIGAVLPGDFKIKKAKLRGVESNGMLCAAEELGLASSSDGLLELPEDAPVGTSLRDFLGLDDVTIDIDLTPNRSDCLSILGLAREVGVLNGVPFLAPAIDPVPAVHDRVFPVMVADALACPRYLGRVVSGVDLSRPSPQWLQERLRRSGLRSIDAVVDVTNYVMLELGQPMHAFDLDELAGGIVVRPACDGEKLVLLDGQEVCLRRDTLVIADESRALAVAGVMGGASSGVSAETRNIFLECAFFSPLLIAGKARSYGLHTDSSHRFERGVDFELQHRAIERATALLLEIVGGQPGPVIDVVAKDHLPAVRSVTLRAARLRQLLGADIPSDRVEEILERLGLTPIEKRGDGWTYRVPSFRFDIGIEPDLIEEVGRIHGYDKLPKTKTHGAMMLRRQHESVTPLSTLADRLVALGYQEAITYSFVDETVQKQIDPESELIRLANPISSDMSVMRTSLLPGLLGALRYNQNRQQSRVRLFESGLRFQYQQGVIQQTRMLAGLAAGPVDKESWANETRPIDFYDVKADLESLLWSIDPEINFVKGHHAALHPGQCAEIVKQGVVIGHLGAIHPKLQNSLDINGPVYLFELCLDQAVHGQVPHFNEVSRYPEVRRDLAVILGANVGYAELERAVLGSAGNDLSEVTVFDVFSGANIGDGMKSVALRLTWQRTDRTLQDDDVNQSFEKVIAALSDKFDAKLRS
jgi:phenylalanyl-tRNA synthetase beta chain